MAGGYFLVQHRQQLGRKHIWKVRVWESGDGVWANPNILFYITDRNPWEGSDSQQQLEQQMDEINIAYTQRRRRKRGLAADGEAGIGHTSQDGKSVVREHIMLARL